MDDFDIKTARPVEGNDFDLSTAREFMPADQNKEKFSLTKAAMIAKASGPAYQKVGETIKENAPELAGSMAGMFMGGPFSGAAVSAAGAAAGEGIRQFNSNEQMSPTERLKNVGYAALRGGTGETLGRTVSGIRNMVGEKAPAAIYNKFFDVSKAQAVPDIARDADTFGEKMLKEAGTSGTRESVLNKAKFKVLDLENKIQGLIKKSPKNLEIDTIDVAASVDPLIEKYQSVGDTRAARQLINLQNNFLEKHGQRISVESANELKRIFHEVISDKAYLKALESNPSKIQGQRLIASKLREKVAELIPGIASLNAEQGKWIGARDSLIQAIGGSVKNLTEAVTGDVVEPILTKGAKVANVLVANKGIGPSGAGTKIATQLTGQAYNRQRFEELKKKRQK